MPPYRNVHQSAFGSFGPGPFSYGAVPSAQGTTANAFEDVFQEMARSMREAFASFETVNADASTTPAPATSTSEPAGSGFTFTFPTTPGEHGLPREGPLPPLFGDHRPQPYGFNWNESTTNGAAHPGSMPYNPSQDSSNPHNHHHHHGHHHGGPGRARGRYTPYGRGGPPPHFCHHHHPPPPPFGPGHFPFGFGGPFGHDGPFGFRGPWNHRPPPPPFAANMEEEFSKAREQQSQSWQKLYERLAEMRNRMHGARHGHDDHSWYHGPHPGRGRGGYHGRGRGGYQHWSHDPFENFASASGSGGPPPRSGARSRSAPASKDASKPSHVDVAKAWETYSAQWKKLTATDAPATINLSEVPWPVIVDTSKMKTLAEMTDVLTATTVGEFILSPKHSPDASNKKRIHHALRLYHPDRFETTVVAKLEEKDKKAVRELGEVVAKCLNKLLEKEN